MRKITVIIYAALMVCVCPLRSAFADGREIALTLTDGRVLEGELLLVRAESFVISTTGGLQEKELLQHPEYLIELPVQEVTHVSVGGRSNALLGMGLGLVAGAAGGAAIWEALDDDPESSTGYGSNGDLDPLGGALLGGIVGLIGGGLAGGSITVGGEEFDADTLHDLDRFRQYARYDEAEPDFLRVLLH